MTQDSDELCVTAEALEHMLAHFRLELPREGCGFLAGRGRLARRFYPIHNINPDLRRFLMDPLHAHRTELSILRRGQRILGICHSHPEGECYPSRWDISGSFFDADLRLPMWIEEVQVIALMASPKSPLIRGFRIETGGKVTGVPLRIEEAEPLASGGEVG